jgi:cyclohexadieny/prephenate dehydrogenase
MFERVALIGLGLIGSSLCHVMRREGLAGHIAGHARSAETRNIATDIGLIDSVHETAAEAVVDADLVILCVPVGAIATVMKEVAPSLKTGSILSDVGSVKGAVVAEAGPHVPQGVHFIPAHPIAGTEESGPNSGFAELFEGRWCVLTPPDGTDAAAVARLGDFWSACGSSVEHMAPDHHDLVLAVTSHLPHLIAYNIVGTAADLEQEVTKSEVIKYSAGGFRDFTRLAASDPVMWRDVFLANREAVLEMLGRFTEDLTALQRAIRRGDGDALHALFTRTRDIRRGIIDAGQDEALPDFGRHGDIKHPDETDEAGD